MRWRGGRRVVGANLAECQRGERASEKIPARGARQDGIDFHGCLRGLRQEQTPRPTRRKHQVPSIKHQEKCGEAADSLLVLVTCYLSLRPAGRDTTLTLHFCDEVFANATGKKFRGGTREPPGPDIRTPHLRAPARAKFQVTSFKFQGSSNVSRRTFAAPLVT